MPFKKGKSGNPTGRKPHSDSERRVQLLARQHTERAIHKLAACIDDEDGRIACMAASAILDRGWGKPTQHVEGKLDVNHTVATGDADSLSTRLQSALNSRTSSTIQ